MAELQRKNGKESVREEKPRLAMEQRRLVQQWNRMTRNRLETLCIATEGRDEAVTRSDQNCNGMAMNGCAWRRAAKERRGEERTSYGMAWRRNDSKRDGKAGRSGAQSGCAME